MLMVLPAGASIGSLVAFRVLYYFVPLLIGAPLFLLTEILARREGPGRSEPSGEAAHQA